MSRTAVIFLSSFLPLAAQDPSFFPILTSVSFPHVASPVVYGLQNGSPMRSSDNGQTWTPIYVSNPGTAQNITAVVVQPDNPAIVYAITSMDRGGVWKSTNSGATFAPANSGLPAGSAPVQVVHRHRQQPANALHQVFRSTVGGRVFLDKLSVFVASSGYTFVK